MWIVSRYQRSPVVYNIFTHNIFIWSTYVESIAVQESGKPFLNKGVMTLCLHLVTGLHLIEDTLSLKITTSHSLGPITGSLIHNDQVKEVPFCRVTTSHRIGPISGWSIHNIQVRGVPPWLVTTGHWLGPITGSPIHNDKVKECSSLLSCDKSPN